MDALLKIGIDLIGAEAMITWITEPDGSAHSDGIGSPLCLEALGLADREIARILAGLEERGLLDSTNLLIISDHGFSTRTGDQSLAELLIEKGLKADKPSTDVVIANDAIYVNEDRAERIPRIVRALQQAAWIGPVFTKEIDTGSDSGRIAGSLSFSSVMWNHPYSADILTSGNWTNQPNQYGYKGGVMLPGTAGHNSTSPYDIRAAFFASGPDFKSETGSRVPSGNVDIAPTVLYLLGIDDPEAMDGRILLEALKKGPLPVEIQVKSEYIQAETRVDNRLYKTVLYKSFVDGTAYIDSTVTTRY